MIAEDNTPRRGRPPTPERDQRRGKQGRDIKISANEHRELAESAFEAGQSLPDYVMALHRAAVK